MPPLSRRAVAVAFTALVLVGCAVAGAGLLLRDRPEPRYRLAGASADRGHDALSAYGCTSCHTIPGVRDADATVGPPLERWAERGYVAGRLANTPENLVRWIMHPQEVVPGNAMPELDVSDADARDIAQYLYGLR